MIDWMSPKNELLLNPRMPGSLKEQLLPGLCCIQELKGMVCLATSGTSGALKWAVLSKRGILASAQAVNTHLNSDSSDCWLNPLPDFHVGGLGIFARGYLSRADVAGCHFPQGKWDALYFFQQLKESRASLTSLVPTQVFDLVSKGLKAPPALRAAIVGGGALSERLYFSAVELGWHLLPSYGLTECASQVATAEIGSWDRGEYPLLSPLSHVRLETDEHGYLKIQSEALFEGYIEHSSEKGFYLRDPKVEGWLTTEDRVVFSEKSIRSVSRGRHFIKIGGESVDLLLLEKILEEEKLDLRIEIDAVLFAVEEERLGHQLHLAVASPTPEHVQPLIDHYHQRVFPFERIGFIHYVAEIPRSPLGKPLVHIFTHEYKSEFSSNGDRSPARK